jgi:hypothetical protein
LVAFDHACLNTGYSKGRVTEIQFCLKGTPTFTNFPDITFCIAKVLTLVMVSKASEIILGKCKHSITSESSVDP